MKNTFDGWSSKGFIKAEVAPEPVEVWDGLLHSSILGASGSIIVYIYDSQPNRKCLVLNTSALGIGDTIKMTLTTNGTVTYVSETSEYTYDTFPFEATVQDSWVQDHFTDIPLDTSAPFEYEYTMQSESDLVIVYFGSGGTVVVDTVEVI